MQKKKYTAWIAVGVIALLALFILVTYNRLVAKDENVNRMWADVQATYQRRLDLIPNLVNVVKGVSDFESGTLEKIASARAEALSGQSDNSLTPENYNRQNRLQDTLAANANRLIILIEKYPALKGTAAYSGLQAQLEGTERRIKVARNDFNESVNVYNQKVRSFPSNIIAGMFGFKRKDGFTADAGSDKAVEINFKK